MGHAAQAVKVRRLAPDEANATWPAIEPMVRAALEQARGEYDVVFVEGMIRQGRAKVATVKKGREILAAVVYFIVEYQDSKNLRVWLMGGHGRDEWAGDLLAYLDEIGRAEGVREIELGVRPGLVRILKGAGYELAYNEMRRYIGGGHVE